MELCSTCRQFSLHDFPRQPDYTCSWKLSTLEEGEREQCAFCSFLITQLQGSLLEFAIHPSKTWVRMKVPVKSGQSLLYDRKRGLQLHEVELFLADTALETKVEHRSEGIFLGLAASPSEFSAFLECLLQA